MVQMKRVSKDGKELMVRDGASRLLTMRAAYFLAFATSAAVTAGAALPQALRI
jgi:hypothetical protein